MLIFFEYYNYIAINIALQNVIISKCAAVEILGCHPFSVCILFMIFITHYSLSGLSFPMLLCPRLLSEVVEVVYHRGRSLAVHGLHSDVYLFVLPYFLCSLLINKSLNDQLVKMKDYAYKLLSTFLIHLKYHLNQFYMRITLKKNFLIAYLAIIILI